LQSFTGFAIVLNSTATLTTSWARYSYTVTLASTVTEFGVNFLFTPVGTAGAADSYDITGVQIELGSVATNFKRASGGTIQQELAACQRYFYLTNSADGAYTQYGIGQAYSTSAAKFNMPFPVTMRIAPTSVVVTGNIGLLNSGDTAINNGTVAVNVPSNNRASLQVTGSSGVVAGNATAVMSNNSLVTSLAFSAEL
jgi:hypothetical protein